MNVWLLHVGEDLPVDDRPRMFRYGHLAAALNRRGHEVLRWAPTFHHARKQQRAHQDALTRVSPTYQIQLIHAPGYRKNVSWARFRSYQRLATRFSTLADRHPRPDVIVAGIPSPAWCQTALTFAESQQLPLVVDVRDLWPDVFLTAAPSALKPLARRVLHPLSQQANRVCRRATSLAAVSDGYLQWGLQRAGRTAGPLDRTFPLGYSQQSLCPRTLQQRLDWLTAHGVRPEKMICCFFGLFERSYDLHTLLDAARLLQQRGRDDVQLVLCGAGGQERSLQAAAQGLDNVRLLGWVDPATITALMSVAKVGLAAYAGDALQGLPNKPFEYMAGRLAIVSSLAGELQDLLAEHQCGVTYPAGDRVAVANALAQLADAPQQLDALRERAYRLYQERYDASRIADRFAIHLEHVAGHASGQRRQAA